MVRYDSSTYVGSSLGQTSCIILEAVRRCVCVCVVWFVVIGCVGVGCVVVGVVFWRCRGIVLRTYVRSVVGVWFVGGVSGYVRMVWKGVEGGSGKRQLSQKRKECCFNCQCIFYATKPYVCTYVRICKAPTCTDLYNAQLQCSIRECWCT